MLTMTDNASAAVKSIAESRPADNIAGLRISGAEESESLSVMLAQAPEEADQVIENDGARVFLEQRASAILDDKILDAQTDHKGKLSFVLAQQGA